MRINFFFSFFNNDMCSARFEFFQNYTYITLEQLRSVNKTKKKISISITSEKKLASNKNLIFIFLLQKFYKLKNESRVEINNTIKDLKMRKN